MRYFTTEELKENNRDEVARVLKDCVGKNVRYNLAFELIEDYAKRAPAPQEVTILDLGVASGYFLKQLHKKGYRNLFAHDIDEYLPPETKKLFREFKTAELNTEKLPWPDNSFDFVTAWCVLPHLENPFHAAREAHRVLKPGGIFLFSAPHLTSRGSIDFFLKYGYFAGYRETNNHIAMLPPSIVKKTLSKYFTVLDLQYLVVPKIFAGLKGRIREALYGFSKRFPRFRTYLGKRWGYNLIYILQKPQ